MKIRYSKLIDLRSKRGLRQAERLLARGWRVASVGFHTIQFFHAGLK